MSIFLDTFVLYIPSLPLLNFNIQQRVMATHDMTVGGSGEPLQIPINEVFTFQGRPDK